MFTVFGAYNRDTSIAKRTLENNIITVDPLKQEDVYIEIIGAVNQNGDVKNNKIIIKNMLGDTVMAGITDKGDAIGNEIFIENGSFFGYTGVKKFNEYGEPEDVAGNTASLIAGYTANGNADKNIFTIKDGDYRFYNLPIAAGYSSMGGSANENQMTISTPAFGTPEFPVSSVFAGRSVEGAADGNYLTFINSNVNADSATFAAGYGATSAKNNTLTLKNSVIEAPGSYLYAA